jgi:hypothetical protein
MILIGLTIYLVALFFFIGAVNITTNNSIKSESTDKSILAEATSVTIVTTITDFPIWFNTIFIIIPLIFEIYLIIASFFLTANAGA